ncbi:MAG: PilN domain-containing protein [Desulfobacter sp.]|nr:MAG: PilN domain-containing protein [Desulfobacter sp.]
MACLYLDIDETGISARTPHQRDGSPPVRINFEDLPETDSGASQFDTALGMLDPAAGLSECKQAVVTLPPDWVWFRYTSLPFKDKKKLGQILPLELTPSFPDPDPPVVQDFHVSKYPVKGNLYLVFTGTLAKTKIQGIFTALSAMGIAPAVITPRGLVQALAFAREQRDYSELLYIHNTRTEAILTLVKEGFPIMVRALKQMESDPAPSLAREIRSTLACAGVRLNLAPETLRGLPVFLSSQAPEEGLADRINAALKEAGRPLQEAGRPPLQVKEVAVPPWEEMVSADHRPAHLLNFCVGPFRTNSFWNKYKGRLITTLVLALLVFGLGVIDLHRKNSALDARITSVRKASMAVYQRTFPRSGPVPAHAPLMLMESKVKQARLSRPGQGATALPQVPRIGVMEILHELSARIPGDIDVEITRLALNHDRLVLTGLTANFNHVDRIKGLVQASPRFKNVSIQSAAADKTGKQVRFKFILEI